MLDERIIDKLVERLVDRVERLNTYTLKKMGESIKKVGTLSPYQAQALAQVIRYGGNYDKIVNELARVTELNIRDIYEIFEEIAKNDYAFAEQFYKYRGKQYIPYEQNYALKRQVEAIARTTANEYLNISQTLAFARKVNGKTIYTPLSITYQNLIDDAVLSVAQGRDTFKRQMYSTIKELASSGLKKVDYPSGYARRIDSSVRMNLMGGIRHLHNEIQAIVGEEIEADGVEISVHINPAPDHERVQGRQFSNEEFEKFQTNQDAVDYKGRKFSAEFKGHDRRSISEWNCYHYTFAIILGLNEPNYTDAELQKIIDDNRKGFTFEDKQLTMYEGTQLQRQIETEVRKAKDTQIMARASGNDRLVSDMQEKITNLTHKYRELSQASGLPTKMDRMRVSGYHRVRTKREV